MRNLKPMQINLLEYKLRKKETVQNLTKIIITTWLIVSVTFISFYALYSKAMEDKSKSEAIYKQLQKEQAQLIDITTNYDDSRYTIRCDLINQFNKKPISIVPQLNYIYTVAGTDIVISSIIIDRNEVLIEAKTENCESVRSYMDQIINSDHFGLLREFKYENWAAEKEIVFTIKLFRRQ